MLDEETLSDGKTKKTDSGFIYLSNKENQSMLFHVSLVRFAGLLVLGSIVICKYFAPKCSVRSIVWL